jgi:ADP-ribosyl-[dinitrogen reductase] hydrolase
LGGGPFGLECGKWTDDTSMALCLAESLLERNGFDARDQMERYVRWWKEGHLSSTGRCFYIGLTIRSALRRFLESGEPFAGSTDPQTAGNGSLMRLAPVALVYFPNMDDVAHFSRESSRTTHAAPEAMASCQLFGLQIAAALEGKPKDEILAMNHLVLTEPKVAAIAAGAYHNKARAEIVGSGYCVQSLEAALWCFDHTDSFAEAILEAANLGDDADTTAAIAGQLAGAYYGSEAIPEHWLNKLYMRAEIEAMADGLYARSRTRQVLI